MKIVICLISIIVFNVGMDVYNVLILQFVQNVFLATTFKMDSVNVKSVNKIVGNALHLKIARNV